MNIFTEEERRKKADQAKIQAELAKAAEEQAKMKAESEKPTPTAPVPNLTSKTDDSISTAVSETPLMPNRKARQKAKWKEKQKLRKQNRNNSNDGGQKGNGQGMSQGSNPPGPMNGGGLPVPREPGPGGPMGQGGPMGHGGPTGLAGPMRHDGPIRHSGPMGPGGSMGPGGFDGPRGPSGPIRHDGPMGHDGPRGPGVPIHHPMGPRFGAPMNGAPYRHRAAGEFEFQPRSSYGPPGFRPRGFPPNQQFRPPQNQPQPPNQQFRHEQHYPNQGWVETGPPRQQRPLVEPPGNAMPPQSINQNEINRRIEANKKRGTTKVKTKAPKDPAQLTPKSKTVRKLILIIS